MLIKFKKSWKNKYKKKKKRINRQKVNQRNKVSSKA